MLGNKIVYYISIFAPLAIIYVLVKSKSISPEIFCGLLAIYLFIYRKFTDIFRLIQIGILDKKDRLKYMLPWQSISLKYFKQLYL